MKISEHFELHELVHPDIYNHPHIGDRSADWLNVNLAPTLQALKDNLTRELDGVIEYVTVNNWHNGGHFKDSGLRSNKKPYGGRVSYSAHYAGTAADAKYKIHTPAQVYDHIMNNQELYPYILRMEHIDDTPTWNHLEVSTLERVGEIYIFHP